VEDFNFLYVAFNYTPALAHTGELISHCCCRGESWFSDCIYSTSRWAAEVWRMLLHAFESLILISLPAPLSLLRKPEYPEKTTTCRK